MSKLTISHFYDSVKIQRKFCQYYSIFAPKCWRETYLRKIMARFAFCIKRLCSTAALAAPSRDWMKIKEDSSLARWCTAAMISSNLHCHLSGESFDLGNDILKISFWGCEHLHLFTWFFQITPHFYSSTPLCRHMARMGIGKNFDPDICGALSDKCSGAGDWRDESFWKIKGHLGHSLRYIFNWVRFYLLFLKDTRTSHKYFHLVWVGV